MRVPWFNRRGSGQGADAAWGSWAMCAPHERTEDEIALALRLIPLYRVTLRVDDPQRPQRAWWPLGWRATLVTMLGVERAQRALHEASELGATVIAICPRELAEHYCDELARHALPCDIQSA